MKPKKLTIADISEVDRLQLQNFMKFVESTLKLRGQIMDSDLKLTMQECFLDDLSRRIRTEWFKVNA